MKVHEIALKIFSPSKIKGDNHQVIINKKSNKLIIFFSDKDTQKNEFDFFYISTLLDSNIIFVNNGCNEWYENGIASIGSSFQDVLSKLEYWIKYLKIKEIYTCGEGMGAYGAILYGLHLKDAKILSLSLKTPSKKITNSSFNQIENSAKIHFNLKNLMKNSQNKIYMFVGENDAQSLYNTTQFNSILEFPNIRITSIQDIGHTLKNYFDKKNITASLIQNFINNEISNTPLEEGFACSNSSFANLYLEQTKSNKEKKWKESIQYGKEAIKQYPYSSNSQYLLAKAYLKIKDLDNALIHASLARSFTPTNLDYQFLVANIFRRKGIIQKARYLHNKILQNNKNYAKSHYELSLIYAKIGDKENTLARIKAAQNLEPKNITFKEKALIFNAKFN